MQTEYGRLRQAVGDVDELYISVRQDLCIFGELSPIGFNN
jgi:hypothetical protein